MEIIEVVNALAFAESIAAEAGALALGYYRRRDSLSIARKQPLDVVTEADHHVERLVRERIRSEFPEDGFFGEESVRENSPAGRTWVVDPIDGTLNFVRGIDDWAVSIGLLDAGEPVAGVIDMPALGRRVAGGRGMGATLNGASIAGCPSIVPTDAIVGIGLFATTPLADQIALVRALGQLGYSFRRNGSSSVTLAMVARGQLDAFVAFDVSAWDVAAGVAITEALGFACTLDWRSIDLARRIRVACAPPSLLPTLAPLVATRG